MATFTFFHEFKKHLGEKKIDLSTDTFKVYLTNNTPNVADHTVKGDLASISGAGGYVEKTIAASPWAETSAGSGTWRFKNDADIQWTASGAAFDQFRYIVLYDDTPAATPTDPLIGYWDYGVGGLTLGDGDSFTVDLDANYTIFTL